MGRVNTGINGGTTVSRNSGHTVPGEGMQDTVLVDAPDTVGADVSDDQVAIGSSHHAHGPTDICVLSGYAVAVADPRNTDDGVGVQLLEKLELIQFYYLPI